MTTAPAPRRKKLTVTVGSTVGHQVTFCGPTGVGKTTAVRAVSTTSVASTDADWSAARNGQIEQFSGKDTTTVGIDYGEWHPATGEHVALYGTPGQTRFADARRGVTGSKAKVVLWLFGDHDRAVEEAKEWLALLAEDDVIPRLTVAVTRLDDGDPFGRILDLRDVLDGHSVGIPLVTADPRKCEDVEMVIRAALKQGV